MRSTLLLIGFAVLPFSAFAAERPSADEVWGLAKQYADRINPTLDPARFEILLRPLEVPDLWDKIGAQVWDVNWTMDGKWFSGYVGLYRDGKLLVLAPNAGGRGLMSAVFQKGVLYFTFSWGESIHRSHVGRMEFVDGRMSVASSGGYKEVDLFISAKPDGTLQVVSGRFEEFNSWKDPKDFGTVKLENPAHLGVIGADGKTIVPSIPR